MAWICIDCMEGFCVRSRQNWRNATTCMFLYGAVVTRPCTIGLTLAVGVFVLL